MKGKFLFLKEGFKDVKIDIFADKSSLILEWILFEGLRRENFSIREVQREISVSIGLIQKVFQALVYEGFIESKGIRTSKKFKLKKGRELLEKWQNHYKILEKCKVGTFKSGIINLEEKIYALNKIKNKNDFSLALHSAVRNVNLSNTNLKSLEIYMENENIYSELEKGLLLDPSERGYDVLLIKPFYKSILKKSKLKWSENENSNLKISPPLLTYLDLYNYPLRGREQAEFLINKEKYLRDLYKNKIKK